MKYKKGDKVRVRNKLKIEACYGKLKDGCGVVFCFEQSQYKGHTVTIDRVNDYGGYKILEDACNFTWTDEMFENICYKNFGIRGSFIQLTAFKEVTEEMGYKYRKSFIDFSAENFKIDDGNLSRGLFFSILGVDSVIKKGEMSLSRLHGEYEENIIFTIPSQISEAYLYAKEALEWLRLVKYPEYVIVEKAEIGSGQASNGMYGKKSDKPHANGCVGTPDVVYELANGKVWGFLDGSQFKAITKDEYEEEIKKTNVTTHITPNPFFFMFTPPFCCWCGSKTRSSFSPPVAL